MYTVKLNPQLMVCYVVCKEMCGSPFLLQANNGDWVSYRVSEYGSCDGISRLMRAFYRINRGKGKRDTLYYR
jgi:hypothetical protein